MSLLDSIQSGRAAHPPRILIYGTEGIGKSCFAAQAPKPIFIQTEDGLGEIDCNKFPLVKSLDEVFTELASLASEAHIHQTVVIDSLDWLERLIFDQVCAKYGVQSIEKADGGYARGYGHALGYWRRIVDALDVLRHTRGMAVILVSHAKIERFEDPEAAAYDRYSPRLHKLAAAYLCEWCDAVLFATRCIRTQSEDAGFGRTRTIAASIGKDGGERIIRTVGGPACVAKNRYSLPSEIPLDWSAFVAGLSTQS